MSLYQCFLTLPSVRFGNSFAISPHELPASRKVFSRRSSAGVHGVFVRDFLAGGVAEAPSPVAASASWLTIDVSAASGFTAPSVVVDGPAAAVVAPVLVLVLISAAFRLRAEVGELGDLTVAPTGAALATSVFMDARVGDAIVGPAGGAGAMG